MDKMVLCQNKTDKQVLEAKTSENTGKVYGEQYTPSAEKRTYYFDNNYAVKTGWIYEDGNWYYLNKLEILAMNHTIHYQLVKWLRGGLKIFMLLLTLIEANLLHGTI